VAIPARDEEAELPGCLQALASQVGANIGTAVVCLNNCTDGSAAALRHIVPTLPFHLEILDVELPRERAWAGTARRLAMHHAARCVGPHGILLTTDADGRAMPGWVAANLAALAMGADAVAGQADIEPAGARRIPAHLHAADAEECAYAALLDEIACLIDPDPADPWPRHDEHSGASIAVTVQAYRRAGGVPAVPLGEDRAFFAALRRIDARIRHAPDARVVVSARIVGRAAGGMADTMRRRLARSDETLDERLEAATVATRRAVLRARVRRVWLGAQDPTLPAELGLDVVAFRAGLGAPFFGAGWAAFEALSPVLRRRPVPVARLAIETARARAMRDALRDALGHVVTPAAGPVDMFQRVAAASA
jgi:hypothetical protein